MIEDAKSIIQTERNAALRDVKAASSGHVSH
jgi:hypothetical protein